MIFFPEMIVALVSTCAEDPVVRRIHFQATHIGTSVSSIAQNDPTEYPYLPKMTTLNLLMC